jgi:hypothetical protein
MESRGVPGRGQNLGRFGGRLVPLLGGGRQVHPNEGAACCEAAEACGYGRVQRVDAPPATVAPRAAAFASVTGLDRRCVASAFAAATLRR